MEDVGEMRLGLLRMALSHANLVYTENAHAFELIDDKAQKVGGIACAFLALPYVGMHIESLEWLRGGGGEAGLILMFCMNTFLVLTIGFSLATMWARRGRLPLVLSSVTKSLENLFSTPESELSVRQENFLFDHLRSWERHFELQRSVLVRKGRFLMVAQLALALSLLSVATLFLSFLIGYPVNHLR